MSRFVFIEQLGIKPSLYGFCGLLIAAATIMAARISYRQSIRCSAHDLIQRGAGCVFAGGVIFTLCVLTGIFEWKIAGILISAMALFLSFLGIGLIIPNSLSIALKPHQRAAGTAGSIFGGLYYCLIAGFTWSLGVLHNGTALPLPLYITALGLVLACGCRMVSLPQTLTP